MGIIYNDPVSGRQIPSWLSEAVDQLLFKVRKKGIWEIVDFCIQIWATKYPSEHKKFFKEMKAYKSNRLNKFASSKTNSTRELVSIPRELNFLLDKIAADKIADYGPKKFWRAFAKRYSGFSPATSI